MKILNIETSCDDTGISILEVKGGTVSPSFKVLANNVASQIAIHSPYGGVYPKLAKREHIKNLPIVLEQTLKDAKLGKNKKPADLITVTYGPGLEPALWTGIVFAKELAKKWKVPIVPVNHMEGHIFSVFPNKNRKEFQIPNVKFPTLALLVSGGHTELILMKKLMDYKIIGETVDDAVGEAFDKVARMLDLPYPGGPEISWLAEQARNAKFPISNSQIKLPRPMLKSKDFNFSYSGLKTAVLYLTKKIGILKQKTKTEIALEFENAAIECLTYKTTKAIEKYKIKTLIVAGGVSANKHLRNEMKKNAQKYKVKFLLPDQDLTGDNSLMIGIAGYMNYLKNKKKIPRLAGIKAVGNLRLK